MFYLDPKIKVTFLKVTNPGKLIPFSRVPQKSLDPKPLRFSTVSNYIFDFIDINLKPLVLVQPFGQGKACKIQGLSPGQPIENAGNNQNTILLDIRFDTIQKYHHLEASKKPFKNYHIKTAYQSDALIIPFLFTFISHITCIQILQNVLTIFHRRVYSRFD